MCIWILQYKIYKYVFKDKSQYFVLNMFTPCRLSNWMFTAKDSMTNSLQIQIWIKCTDTCPALLPTSFKPDGVRRIRLGPFVYPVKTTMTVKTEQSSVYIRSEEYTHWHKKFLVCATFWSLNAKLSKKYTFHWIFTIFVLNGFDIFSLCYFCM